MATTRRRIDRIKPKKVPVVALILIFCLWPAAWGAEILIIANKNVPQTSMTQDHLEDIFLGKIVQWENNHSIHVAILKDSNIHDLFLNGYLNKSSGKWKTYWKRMVFTGRGLPPKSINSEAELIEYVAGTDGAIGYVTSDGLPEDFKSETVNIVKVNVRR